MNIFLIALIEAAAVIAILLIGRFTLGRRIPVEWPRLARWAAITFVVNYLLSLFILYTAQPALTGPYGGWQWALWPLFLTSVFNLFSVGRILINRANALGQQPAFSRRTPGNRTRIIDINPDGSANATDHTRGKVRAGIVGMGVVVLLLLIVNPIWTVATTWFDGNAKALAHIPMVTIESSKQSLPSTNTDHIVLVSQDVAAYKGQQVLGQTGQNLGSTYHLEQDQYALQAVDQHLYWIAPLVYNNIFTNLSNSNTPGYVKVDAENPDAQAQLYTGSTECDGSCALHYVPGALFNQDLIRHVYLSGYTYGDLVDPTLEVNDSWKPYFTISLMQPSRGFTGELLDQVLLVDPLSGDIQSYAPQDVPSWVDRVMPSDTVSQYLTWWGQYENAPWFNPSGSGQQTPVGDPELVYNDVDKPVWLVPMTSSSGGDNSSTGVFLFSTRGNSAQFFPLSGLAVGDTVTNAFESNPHNIRNYSVSSVQLYSIYGEPTWVAIFVQSASIGSTFQAVGFLDARDVQGANVQMESTRDAALADYSGWLASHGNTAGGPSQSGTPKQMQGVVKRIAPVTQGNSTVYYIWIVGQSHIFTADLNLSPKLPLVQPGDTVTGTYLDTSETVEALQSFDDTSIQLGAGTPTPTPTPTAGG
ncbi:MAG TPA: hypothetical protein VKT82_03530 [Ktedonobacterales bacterium]|nr:hypothetical protein [Ktedonobacterales bacterium]